MTAPGPVQSLSSRIRQLAPDPEAMQPLLDAVLALLPAQGAPLLGWYVHLSPDGAFTAWLVTASALTRYETAGGVAMTITVPAHRLCRLVERLGPGGLEVALELDADDALLRAVDDTGTVSRVSRTSYVLAEPGSAPAAVTELHAFATTVRALLHRG